MSIVNGVRRQTLRVSYAMLAVAALVSVVCPPMRATRMTSRRRGIALLLALFGSATPSGALAGPFTGFAPASGPGCSRVVISGQVPKYYTGLRVTFDGIDSPLVGVSYYRPNPIAPATRVINAIVPANASTGLVTVRIVALTSPSGSGGKLESQTFSTPFAVRGPKITRPVISSFTATPDLIFPAAGGSTLRWSISGNPTFVTLNGVNEGKSFFGHYSFASGAHAVPTQTTTYRLIAGDQCVSSRRDTVVTVTPRIDGNFFGPLQFTNARDVGSTSPKAPVPGACFATVGLVTTSIHSTAFSCPGTGFLPGPNFFVSGSDLGGMDSFSPLFVIADLATDLSSVTYHTFELPSQLSGGFTFPGIPLINYAQSEDPPAFYYSRDASLGAVTWDFVPGPQDSCKQKFALYNLFTGTVFGQGEFNGQFTAAVSGTQVTLFASAGFSPCANSPSTSKSFLIQ